MDKIQNAIFDGILPCELSGDYILPDSYPDVKKILRVRARPVQIGRFMSGGKLEFNGAVDYIVLFSAENGENETIHSVHFAEEYSSSVSPEGLTGQEQFITVEPNISACSARMQNPRKISLKSTVLNNVKITEFRSTLPKVDRDVMLETLTETLPTLVECSFTADHEHISENIEPDAAQPSIDEIISCDSEIMFVEARPQFTDDGLSVAVKVEAMVDCIYKSSSENADYRSFSRKIQLSYVLNADEYADIFKSAQVDTLFATAVGIPSEIKASIGEDSYGEHRVVEFDMAFDILLTLFGNAETSLTLDAYSIICDTECVKKELDILNLGKVINSNFSVSESVGTSNLGLPEKSDVQWSTVNCQCDISMDKVNISKGRAQISGEAIISCIFCDRSNPNGGFASSEVKIPIKCEVGVGELCEPVMFKCDAKASDIRARIDSERAAFDFEVSLNTVLFGRSRCEIVEDVNVGDCYKTEKNECSTMILYYPESSENNWQVAKKYKMKQSELRTSENGRVIRIR